MVTNIRRFHTPAFKTRVAIEALKGTKTTAELSSYYKIHPTQIGTWKKQALEILTEGFSGKRKKRETDTNELIHELYRHIGKLKVEIDFLKKKMGLFEE